MDRRDDVQSRRERWLPVVGGVLWLLGAFVMFGSVTPAYADVVQCGAVLGPGGRVTLEQDIVCTSNTPPGVTVQDGAILDLNGHTVDCRLLIGQCVVLTGRGAQLLNGKVRGSDHEAIVLTGAGRHTVKNVTSDLVDGNVLVQSDHNTLIDVMAESANSEAFVINGHHNRVWKSIALCLRTATVCITVIGDGNHLIDNFFKSDLRVIFVDGDSNVLLGNRAISTGSGGPSSIFGIIVTGTGNHILRNTSITENGVDLFDGNGDCAHNTWRHNIFVTSDPACIK